LEVLRKALAERQVLLTLWRLADVSVARFALVSRTFERTIRAGFSMLHKDGAGQTSVADRPSVVVRSVDYNVWCRLKDYEPSQALLERWASSAIVSRVLGNLVLESVIGEADELRFADVCRLLAELGLTLEQFVNKFIFVSTFNATRSGRNLEQMAREILAGLSSRARKHMLSFRDLYRLLQIIGITLERFEKAFAHCSDPALDARHGLPQLGRYRILRTIGHGAKGMCYLAEDVTSGAKAAVKWPVPDKEVAALQQILGQGHPVLGLPELLSFGNHQRQAYVATELLGSPLTKVFPHLQGKPSDKRWGFLAALGRLVVRRLQALHACGLVHCDVSPENIVLGPHPRSRDTRAAGFAPFLIDFGLAQRHPGGPRLASGKGSVEWSSVRSADGGEPSPDDDLQALGWVLLTGLLGTLPWFKWLGWAYREWGSRWTRDQAVRQVQQAKLRLLEEGWASLRPLAAGGPVPEELGLFLRACHAAEPGRAPDYAALLALLGAEPGLSLQEAEERDLGELAERLAQLLQ